MALIRRSATAMLPRDAIVLNLAELSEQAAEITRRARDEADRAIAAAQAERRRLLDTATAEGFKAGREAGFDAGLTEGRAQGVAEARAAHAEGLAALSESWRAALDRFEAQRETMLSHARSDVLALALAIARRVTKRAVEVDPGVAASQTAAALELVTRPTKLTLRANPEDGESVRAEIETLATRLAAAKHATLVIDEAVSRGSVVLHTERGRIDAGIETQLDRIIEALMPGGAGAAPGGASGAERPA